MSQSGPSQTAVHIDFFLNKGCKVCSLSRTENKKIKKIDKDLENNGSVIAHKLCGAGNGGFFLTFSKKNTLTIPYSSIKIYAVPDGVKGESI